MYLPLFVNNYIQCKNCSYVLNTIDRMKIGDVDIDIRNPNVDEVSAAVKEAFSILIGHWVQPGT